MKRNCNFNMNPAYKIGLTLMAAGLFARNVLELEGVMANAADFLCGAGVGITFAGLLYGSPKTRPLFDRFCAFKLRLLGREDA